MIYIWLLLVFVILAGGIWLFFGNKKKGGPKYTDDIDSRVNLMIAVPRDKEEQKELKDKISPMATVMSNLANIDEVIGDRHLTFEIATEEDSIIFYVSTPKDLVEFVEKQITSQYPEAVVEPAPYPNIFPKEGKVVAAQLKLKKEEYFPIQTYERLTADGLYQINGS